MGHKLRKKGKIKQEIKREIRKKKEIKK